MAWSSEIRAAHEALSPVDWRFRELATGSPELLRRATFRTLQEIPRVEDAAIQPWPAFVERRRIRRLAEVSIGLNRLIGAIPRRVFGNDPHEISAYYGLDSPEQAAIMLEPPNAIAEGLARGDFVLDETGWRCIELNVAGNLGGWQTSAIAERLVKIPAFARFLDDVEPPASVVNTVRALFGHVVRRARAAAPDDDEVNVVVALSDEFAIDDHRALRAYVKSEFDAVCRALAPPCRGAVFFAHYADLALADDRIHHRGRVIHAVIESHMERSAEITATAFKAGALHLYNGPISPLLTDKRNLALLSERQDSGVFDDAERELIREHVPWTRTIAEREAGYRGERGPLPALLRRERDRFVIKRAHSFKGLDVVIGGSTPADAWREAVDRAVADGDWIAQERVESLPYLFQDGDYGCAPHDVVWSPFVFGDAYGGTILKMKPKDRGGLVNVAQGATRGILFELG